MLEQSPQTQPQPQPQSPQRHDSPTTTQSSPPLAVLPPQSSAAATTATTTPTSKLPFRPGKIRKLSTDSPSVNPTTTTTTTNNKAIVTQRVRSIPRNVSKTLTSEGEIELAIQHLRLADPLLSQLIDVHPRPTFDSYQPPFLALTKSILYQQLAYKAGTSIYNRFINLCGGEAGVVPEAVLALNQQQLRQIGISNRKASYLQDLANKYCNKILCDSSIVEMDDKSLFTMLTMVKGIGAWSVHMFMIFSLHRPDVLPTGDLGVRKGVQLLYGLEELPRPSQMEQLCDKWRPYRSVASWYMWKFAEAKGVPATAAAMAGDSSQQQTQALQPELIDPIRSILNLGAFSWNQ